MDPDRRIEGLPAGEPANGPTGADGRGEGRQGEDRGSEAIDRAADIIGWLAGEGERPTAAFELGASGKDQEANPSAPSASGSAAGSASPWVEAEPPEGIPSGEGVGGRDSDSDDSKRRAKFLARAKRWLNGSEGKLELTTYMKENLLVNMQYDQEEGQNVRDADSKNAAAVARANRKQFKDTSELVLAITEMEKK